MDVPLLKSHWFLHIFVQKIFYLLCSKESGAHKCFRLGATKKRPPLLGNIVRSFFFKEKIDNVRRPKTFGKNHI